MKKVLIQTLALLTGLLFYFPSAYSQCPTDVTLSTQAEVEAFGNIYPQCTTISGDVQIGYNSGITDIDDLRWLSNIETIGGSLYIAGNSALTNLEGLSALERIDGSLLIGINGTLANLDGLSALESIGRSLYITTNNTLTNLDGLSALKSIGGFLDIGYNSALANLDGLSALESIGEYLDIRANYALTNLDGLSALESIGGYLYIGHNTALTDIDGLSDLKSIGRYLAIDKNNVLTNLDGLSNLKSIEEHLFINENNALTNLDGLSNLKSIKEYLFISENNALTNLDGLSALQSIEEHLYIDHNAALTNLDGLSALERIGGSLRISYNDALTNFDGLYALERIGGSLFIGHNAALTDIDGMQNIDPATITGGGLYIVSNTALSVCNLPNICAYLRGGGKNDIIGNKDQCVNATAITDACPTPPVLAVAGHSDPDRCDLPNGSIQFTTTLPEGSYQLNFKKDEASVAPFDINVTGGSFTLGNLGKGTYSNFSITYNDSPVSDNTPVTIEPAGPPPVLTAGAVSHPTTCGGADGSIAFTTGLADGTYHLAYQKDGEAATPAEVEVTNGSFTLSDLTAGDYSGFSITHNGCVSSDNSSLTLNIGPKILINYFTVNPSQCGGNDGRIHFSGSVPGFTEIIMHYKKNGEAQEVRLMEGENMVIYNLSTGVYSDFYYTDVNGCLATYTGSITLTEPPTPALTAGTASHPTACSGADGSINFTTGLPEGTYHLAYQKDGEPATPAEVEVTNGSFTLGDLTAGDYSAFSITHNGCVSSDNSTKTLSDPAAATISNHISSAPTSCGGSDGSIYLYPTYVKFGHPITLWYKKNGQTDSAEVDITRFDVPALADLGAGVYTDFKYTDHNGCTVTYAATVTLEEMTAPAITAGQLSSPTTCGGTDGGIVFSTGLQDGTYTLTYTKDNQLNSATVTSHCASFYLSGLTAGDYSGFSITHNGCVSSDNSTKTLTDPTPEVLILMSGDNPTACSGSDGMILFADVSLNNSDILNYRKNGQATSSPVVLMVGNPALKDLSAGVYSDFSYTDNNGCTVTYAGPVTLTDPVVVPPTLKEVSHPGSCGADDGVISLNIDLPDGTYTLAFQKGYWTHQSGTNNGIAWSTSLFQFKDTSATVSVSSGTLRLTGLSAGEYSMFLINRLNCDYRYPNLITLVNPGAPAATIAPDGPTELCEDDTLSLTASEGAAYLWSTGETTRTVTVDTAGTYSVTVTMAQGCKSEASITVEKKICNLPPVAVCKPLVVLVANADCYAVLTTDDLNGGSFDPNGDWTRHTLLHTDGVFRPGTYTVTYEVMDPKGAFSTCQSELRVLDHTPPVARARNLNLELDANGQASITLADVDAGSFDNCGPVTLSLNRTTFDCSDLGHLQVRLTVTDAGGNVSEALSDITIVDNSPPVISAANLTLALDENGRAVINRETILSGISDNCGIWNIEVSQSEFTCAHIGENEVVITVEDVQGNRSTTTVIVTVQDTTPPVVSAKDLTLYLDKEGRAVLTTAHADEGSYDNCSIINLSTDREAFGCQDLGQQTLTLTATDAAGNASETTFTVTILDTLAPVVLAKDITLYLDAAGQAALAPEDIDEGSSDNCGIADRSLQYTAFDCGNTGTQPVQYTVTDASGNSTTVVVQVTVSDTTAPEALTQNVVLQLDFNGTAALSADQVDGGSTDNCGIAEMSLSQEVFSCADLGRRLLTLTVRDVNGNPGTARAVAEVTDPNGVCPCSYGVLAFNGITLRNNEVSAGGVGVINSGKKAKLRNTVINRDGTFVKAPQSRFDNESEASTYIRGAAPQPEAFRSNGNKDKKKEKVDKGESLTLAAGRYGKVKAGKDATLTFSGGEVYLRSLKVKKNAALVFTAPTTLLVRKSVKLGKSTALNTGGEQARVYAGGNITAGNASEIRGMLHTRGRLKTRRGGDITSLEGLFVAHKIRGGRNTHWAGGGVLCTGNYEPEPTVAAGKERRQAQQGFDRLSLTDSTDSGIRVNLWPNPVVSDLLKVAVESDTPGGELLLVDMQGKVLIRKAYTGRQSTHEIDMRRALPGTYVLRVSSGGEVKTLRVIKEGK